MPNDTVPCKFCGNPTGYLATKLCQNCWEVSHRTRGMPIEVLVAILKEQGVEVKQASDLN